VTDAPSPVRHLTSPVALRTAGRSVICAAGPRRTRRPPSAGLSRRQSQRHSPGSGRMRSPVRRGHTHTEHRQACRGNRSTHSCAGRKAGASGRQGRQIIAAERDDIIRRTRWYRRQIVRHGSSKATSYLARLTSGLSSSWPRGKAASPPNSKARFGDGRTRHPLRRTSIPV
jgi:hypothetical protein